DPAIARLTAVRTSTAGTRTLPRRPVFEAVDMTLRSPFCLRVREPPRTAGREASLSASPLPSRVSRTAPRGTRRTWPLDDGARNAAGKSRRPPPPRGGGGGAGGGPRGRPGPTAGPPGAASPPPPPPRAPHRGGPPRPPSPRRENPGGVPPPPASDCPAATAGT